MARGRLFKCFSCGLEANRDAVGVLNIGYLYVGGVSGWWPASKVDEVRA